MSRWSVFTVRVLVVVAFALILLFQVLFVPSIIAQSAYMYPMFAYLQVPTIIGSVMLLACGQVVLVCVWRLVDLVAEGRIFDRRAFAWVDTVIVALWAAVGLIIVGAVVVNVTGATGPGLFYPIIIGVVFGTGAALVMGIMRRLLHQATDLRGELDEVV